MSDQISHAWAPLMGTSIHFVGIQTISNTLQTAQCRISCAEIDEHRVKVSVFLTVQCN
jgi:hypothetical protein